MLVVLGGVKTYADGERLVRIFCPFEVPGISVAKDRGSIGDGIFDDDSGRVLEGLWKEWKHRTGWARVFFPRHDGHGTGDGRAWMAWRDRLLQELHHPRRGHLGGSPGAGGAPHSPVCHGCRSQPALERGDIWTAVGRCMCRSCGLVLQDTACSTPKTATDEQCRGGPIVSRLLQPRLGLVWSRAGLSFACRVRAACVS